MRPSSMVIVPEGTKKYAVFTNKVDNPYRFHNNGPAVAQLTCQQSSAAGQYIVGPVDLHPGDSLDVLGEIVQLEVVAPQNFSCAVVEWELRTT